MISSAGKFHFAAGGIVDGFCQTLTVSPSAWLDEKGAISVDTLSRGEKTELNLHCALPGQDDRCLIRIPQQRTWIPSLSFTMKAFLRQTRYVVNCIRADHFYLTLFCTLRCLIHRVKRLLSLPAHKCVCPFRILRDTPMRL